MIPQNLPPRLAAALARVLLLCAFSTLLAPARALGAPTSVQVFLRAQTAFKEEKFKVAKTLLAAVVRKQPDFQPARLLLGRIFFREGKVGLAYKYFKTVRADFIAPDVAYEFGVTMFARKNFRRAVVGFARVPAGSRCLNLAHFYRGISHARLRDWDKTITWLARARDLPANLEATRREALAQARRAARSERSVSGPGNQPYAIAPSTPLPPPPAYVDPAAAVAIDGTAPAAGQGAGASSGSGSAKKAPKPKPPPAGLKHDFTPSLNAEQRAKTTDYFGHSTGKEQSTTTTAKLAYLGKYLGEAQGNGGQPYLSLGLEASQVNLSSKGAKTNYISYTTDPNTILEQEQPLSTGSANNLVVLANPEGSYPLFAKVDASGGYSLQDTLPDFKSDKKSESKGPYATLAYNGETLDVKLTAKMTDDSDANGVVTKNTTVFGGDVAKSFETTTIDLSFTQTTATPGVAPAAGFLGVGVFYGVTQAINLSLTKTFDSFSLNATVLNTSYVADPGLVKAEEDSSLKITMQATKNFEFGGQFILTGGQRMLTAYKVQLDKAPDTPGAAPSSPSSPTTPTDPAAPTLVQKVAVPADGSETLASLSFKMAPLEWIYGQATFNYTQRSFNVSDPKYQSGFEQNVGETVNELVFVLGVSKTF